MASQFFLLPNERGDGSRRGVRPLVGSLLGVAGGLLAAGGTRLPLATLPGLGAVNFFDYQADRAILCLVLAGAMILVSLARFFRLALLGSGVLAGLLIATGLDLQRSFRDLTATAGSETAELAGKVLRATRPEFGAGLLAAGCAFCILAGFIGIRGRYWRD